MEIRSDGTPRFTQTLRWEGDPTVLYYEVTLQSAAGEDISVSEVAEPFLNLNLGPGDYRYRIVLYNVLRKPEVTLPWRDFSVERAETPSLERVAPKLWFVEDAEVKVTIGGENLVAGARVTLSRGDGEDGPVAEAVVGAVSFSPSSLEEGEYALGVTNPGGLSATMPKAILVRHKLGEPEGLVPADGTVFGPADLRRERAIRFSWDAVDEAARYVFSLKSVDDPEREVRSLTVTETSYILDDLTILDRGEFRWTVEAEGTDCSGNSIPAVRAGESSFRIELPELAAPEPDAGDEYYGR